MHLILFIDNCKFIKQIKTIMTARSQGGPHLKQVDDEASNNARICKMTTMPPFKTTKTIHEEDQHGGSCSKL